MLYEKKDPVQCPVYEVTGAIYGLQESGFFYDDFTAENMTANNWSHLFDIEPLYSWPERPLESSRW